MTGPGGPHLGQELAGEIPGQIALRGFSRLSGLQIGATIAAELRPGGGDGRTDRARDAQRGAAVGTEIGVARILLTTVWTLHDLLPASTTAKDI
jgi:hypothetical protein